MSAFTWIGSQAFAYYQRKKDKADSVILENQKRIAFFAVIDAEVVRIIEGLTTAKEILEAVDPAASTLNNWVSHIRIASNNIRYLRSFDHEWDKLYMVGVENIRLLREFSICLLDAKEAFKRVLSQQQGEAMPLFERHTREDEVLDMRITKVSLSEHLDAAISFGNNLAIITGAAAGRKS